MGLTVQKLLYAARFFALLVLSFVLAWKYFEKRAEIDVTSKPVHQFPVLIVRPGTAELVQIDTAMPYVAKSPVDSEIRATSNGDGKQMIELEISSDGLYRARYEATDKRSGRLCCKWQAPGLCFSLVLPL
jgi:hypothetical protein